MDKMSLIGLAGFVAVCFAAAATGALFPPGDWFARLSKPSWNPPNWLFAPVWTLLYVLIAISGWLVWRKFGFAGASMPLTIYGVSLLLNAAWTVFFFGWHRPDLAFLDLSLLWLSIAATILVFYPLAQIAALLLLPYLAWVSFAGLLNLEIWRMNPDAKNR